MTPETIVEKWLSIKANRDTLLVVAYEKPIFDFIKSTSSMISIDGECIFLVNGDWQKIITNDNVD